MARDSYSYLHLPMIAGIILFAVGVKKTLGDVGEPLEPSPRSRSAAASRCTSLAHVALPPPEHALPRTRRGSWCAMLIALIPVASTLPALATLAIVAASRVGLIAYEAIRYAEARDRVRHAPEPATSLNAARPPSSGRSAATQSFFPST